MSQGQRRSTTALAMIVRDEEEVLARCLDSVVDIVDEIVIVDTGSKDKTKEIALSYAHKPLGIQAHDGSRGPGLTLLDFEWCDDFSAARNFALDSVSADWVLQLDADEELAAGSDTLSDIMRDRTVGAYLTRIGVANTSSQWRDQLSVFEAYRLFRNESDIKYSGVIHEGITLSDRWRKSRSSLVINHFGPMVQERTGRSERNIRLLRETLRQYPESTYHRYLLACDLSAAGSQSEALTEYRKCLDMSGVNEPLTPMIIRDLAMLLGKAGRIKEAVALVQNGQIDFPDYTDLYFLEGMLALSVGAFAIADRSFTQCLSLGDPESDRYWVWGGTGSNLARVGLDGARRGVNPFLESASGLGPSGILSGVDSASGLSRTGRAFDTITSLDPSRRR